MNDYAANARALGWLQGRLGSACPVVTWAGVDYEIIPDSAARRQDLVAGGCDLNADLQFEVLISTFGYTDPQAFKGALLQRAIQYLGDDYKVQAVNIRPGGLQALIEANSLTQNA